VIPSTPLFLPRDLTREIAELLPEYLPGVETGAAAITEGRGCWIKAWKALLTVLGRERGLDIVLDEGGDSALLRQLTLYWKRGDGIMAAFLSGWGDREALEKRFQALETIKSPQKAIVYSCIKWQDAVIEQLQAALLRYPHHIEGEQYLLLNLLGAEHKLAAHAITIPRNGALRPDDLAELRPLTGSPFPWGDGRGRNATASRS
jgi:hypothetical protein